MDNKEMVEAIVRHDNVLDKISDGFDKIQDVFDRVGVDMNTAYSRIDALEARISELENSGSGIGAFILGGVFVGICACIFEQKRKNLKKRENEES